jgi:hypothetical protein
MSIGIDQRFEQLSRQSEDDLYRESMVSPVVVKAERRDQLMGRWSRERLQWIAFEALFFLGALLMAACLGYLFYLILGERIQESNTGIDIDELNANGMAQNVVSVEEPLRNARLLMAIFGLTSLIGIYLVRLIIWAVKLITQDPEAA